MLTDDERKTINHAADVLGPSLRDLATRLRAIAAPRVATVGELLATAPVGAIVECVDLDGAWWQISDKGLRWWRPEPVVAESAGWSRLALGMEVSIDRMRRPARLIPADQADASPESRGPIGEW